MPKYKTQVLMKLFEDVAKKAKTTLERSDVDLLAEEINNYGDKPKLNLNAEFIYETQRKVKLALEKGQGTISFSASHINRLAQYLDLRDFSQYKIDQYQDYEENENGENTKKPKNQNYHNTTTIIGKNINKFEGDVNDMTINNN